MLPERRSLWQKTTGGERGRMEDLQDFMEREIEERFREVIKGRLGSYVRGGKR